jgi:hypothetical protein
LDRPHFLSNIFSTFISNIMNAILYFVMAGIVLAIHQAAAAAIATATGKRVVFRNASAPPGKPEANLGVAGRVPAEYASFPTYDDSGTLMNAEVATPTPTPKAKDARKNAIGLPVGCPEDREGLKAALDTAGIEYHGNAKIEKLAGLFLAHYYPEG